MVETNLYGTWYMMQAAAKRWIEDDGGKPRPKGVEPDRVVVNVSTLSDRASVIVPSFVLVSAFGSCYSED